MKFNKNIILTLVLLLVIGFSVVKVVSAQKEQNLYNDIVNGVVDRVTNAILSGEDTLGALTNENAIPTNLDDGEWTAFNDVYADDVEIADDLFVTGDTTLTGSLTSKAKTTAYAPSSTTTTRTLTVAESGTTFLLSASGTVITLPAVTNGVNYKFQINGSADSANIVIDSAEGDNIEGTLIVAGAVVDCDAEDQVNFVTDGENIGDYFEILSDGTQWLLGDSGVLTAGKLTCTDPS